MNDRLAAPPSDLMRRLHRVFISSGPAEDGSASLSPAQAKHIGRVLRMNEGDLIGLLDGRGRGWVAEISSPGARTAHVIAEAECTSAPRRRVNLALPLLKSERMSFALQKCTELGVAAFHIVPAERATAKLKDAEAKSVRFSQVIESAAEQCGAWTLPDVHFYPDINDFFALERPLRRYIAWEEQLAGGCGEIAEGMDEITIAIGPEGGLSANEVASWQQAGFRPVSLGPRILRAETAAVAMAALALIPG